MPPTIVLPPRLTASAERVRDAASRRGLTTTALPGFTVPDGLTADHLHSGPTFADVVLRAAGRADAVRPGDRAFVRSVG